MTNIIQPASWADVPLLETNTAVLGGDNGPMNFQAKALVSRTEFLDDKIDALTASNIDNVPSGTISSTTVQDALNEIVTDLSAGSGAGLVGFTPTGTIAATNVQGAIAEVVSDLSSSTGAGLVGFAPTNGIAATNVQGAIAEIITDLSAGSGAGLVGFTPTGTIAATNVQGAIAELGIDLTAIQNGTVFAIGGITGTNTITGNLTPAITSYIAGQTFRFVSVGANTGAVTININGLGNKAITKSGTNPLTAGDIPSGAAVTVIYDGVQFQLSSGAGSSSSGSVNQLTQSNGISVLAGTGQVLVGPITTPTGKSISVATGSRLVIL